MRIKIEVTKLFILSLIIAIGIMSIIGSSGGGSGSGSSGGGSGSDPDNSKSMFELAYSNIDTYTGFQGPSFIYGSPVLDLNADGKKDIILGGALWKEGFVDESVSFFPLINNDGGIFVSGVSVIMADGYNIPALVHARDFGVSDFNNDGINDLVVAGTGYDAPPFSGERNVLMLSSGAKFLDNKINDPNFDYQGYTHSLCIGDINSDGFQDVVFVDLGGVDVGSDVVRILINDGLANFTKIDFVDPTSIYYGHFWTSSKLADLDNDNFPELILAGGNAEKDSLIFWHDGSDSLYENGYSNPTILPIVQDYGIVTEVETVDLNNDGFNDLILGRTKDSPFYSGRYIQALINNTDGTFTDVSSQYFANQDNTGQWVVKFIIEDINGDNHDDIVLQYDTASDNSNQSIWLKNENEYIPTSNELLPIEGGLIPIDYDNDTDIDLIVWSVDNFGTSSQYINWKILNNTNK